MLGYCKRVAFRYIINCKVTTLLRKLLPRVKLFLYKCQRVWMLRWVRVPALRTGTASRL